MRSWLCRHGLPFFKHGFLGKRCGGSSFSVKSWVNRLPVSINKRFLPVQIILPKNLCPLLFSRISIYNPSSSQGLGLPVDQKASSRYESLDGMSTWNIMYPWQRLIMSRVVTSLACSSFWKWSEETSGTSCCSQPTSIDKIVIIYNLLVWFGRLMWYALVEGERCISIDLVLKPLKVLKNLYRTN